MTGNTADQRIRCLPNNVNNLSDTRVVAAAVSSITNDAIRLSPSTTVRTDADNAFVLQLDNYTSTTTYKPFTYNGFFVVSGPTNNAFTAGGAFRSNTAITSLVFDYGGTNTFAGGTVLLYGVK